MISTAPLTRSLLTHIILTVPCKGTISAEIQLIPFIQSNLNTNLNILVRTLKFIIPVIIVYITKVAFPLCSTCNPTAALRPRLYYIQRGKPPIEIPWTERNGRSRNRVGYCVK